MRVANKPVLAANWKLNPTTAGEAAALVQGIVEAARNQDRVTVAIFPPFLWILGVLELLEGTGIELGAQDCFWEPSGPYTGEVSAAMLAGVCQWVIVGHSERRAMGETDEMVAKKAGAALAAQLSTIVCVGENQEQHDAGQAALVVKSQVTAALALLSADDSKRLVLAYEPIWAIGTGKNADPEHAYKMMRLIRETGGGLIGAQAGLNLRVVYGGSVNAANVEQYVELPQCDGCLVGGASLKADEFSAMIRSTAGVYSAAVQ
ncbi:MAG: triose-phosphate isomerase [Chloroflexi bacterium]|nr:MAG: triose-phosphate isomerase [Chloroflexota bacterium]